MVQWGYTIIRGLIHKSTDQTLDYIKKEKQMTKQKPGTKIIVFGKREEKLFKEFAGFTTVEQLSLICGVSVQTLYNIMGRQPSFRYLYDKEQSLICAKMEKLLVSRAESGDTACLIFFHKTRNPLHQEKKEADSGLTEKITIHRYDGSLDPVKS